MAQHVLQCLDIRARLNRQRCRRAPQLVNLEVRAFPFFGDPTTNTPLTSVTDRATFNRKFSTSTSRQRSSHTSPNLNPHVPST
jgi:hypothetical protein